jgi:acyl carrier protein
VVVQELPHRKKPDLEKVVGRIRQAVADQHALQPHAIVLIKAGALPKTSSGKIQRQSTRSQYLDGSLHVIHTAIPNVDTAESIATPTHQIPVITIQPPRTSDTVKKSDIRDWLVTEVATELQISPTEIDIHQPFTYYGLASVEGAALGGKLESWLGQPVPLSLIWEYPTIDAVSDYFVQG